MSVRAGGLRRRGERIGLAASRFWAGISAIAIKELRGRMRGRRAFAVVTVYLLLLSVLAFGVYHYLRQESMLTSFWGGGGVPRGPDFGMGWTSTGTALSASIGHGIFGSLLAVETLLILVLAPAFTAGAISMEREKQTLDLLVTTPLSTMGMVIGKLVSALAYVFLLIIASIPLASLVFVFGAVGPDDLVRGYLFLFALAFGMGAIGLFISALVRRTQTATVVTYVLVLVLSVATAAAFAFWAVAARTAPSGGVIVTQRAAQPPEALLWLNPFVANMDLICMTAPDTYHDSCVAMSFVTGRPYFGSGGFGGVGMDSVAVAPMRALPAIALVGADRAAGMPIDVECPQGNECEEPFSPPVVEREAPAVGPTLGFPRDTFWPKSAAAFLGLGLLLTLISAQLVAPTRRFRLSLPRRRPALVAAGSMPVTDTSTAMDVGSAVESATTMESTDEP